MLTTPELQKRLEKWHTVEDVARAFAGWYNLNDVRRFVVYLADQYRQGDVLQWAERPRDPRETELYFQVMAWLNLRILRGQYDDALGELYMLVGYPNRDAGQFFTPYPLARLMAETQMPKDRAAALEIANREGGKLHVNDPACGSGVMLCAAWEVARERGYDDLVAFYGQDIDPYCVAMARINLIMRREIPALQQAMRETQALRAVEELTTPVATATEVLA